MKAEGRMGEGERRAKEGGLIGCGASPAEATERKSRKLSPRGEFLVFTAGGKENCLCGWNER